MTKENYRAHERISFVPKSSLPLLTKIEVVKGHIARLPQTGGFSINLNLAEPKSGYMVGGYSDVYENPTDWQIEILLKAATGNFYVGGWVNNGNACIELSRAFANKETAIMVGKAFGEIAVWDVKNKSAIII